MAVSLYAPAVYSTHGVFGVASVLELDESKSRRIASDPDIFEWTVMRALLFNLAYVATVAQVTYIDLYNEMEKIFFII